MSMTEIRINREAIEATDAYKALSKIQKKIVSSRNNVAAIIRGVKVAAFRGYDTWERESNAYPANKGIVKELLTLNEINIT